MSGGANAGIVQKTKGQSCNSPRGHSADTVPDSRQVRCEPPCIVFGALHPQCRHDFFSGICRDPAEAVHTQLSCVLVINFLVEGFRDWDHAAGQQAAEPFATILHTGGNAGINNKNGEHSLQVAGNV